MTACPVTEEEWIKAEKKYNCLSGVYHCLRTRERFLIEICAPRITMIAQGGCPYWNIIGNVDREDCSMYPGCPDEPFLSNQVYKYPFCFQDWSTSTTKPISKTVPHTTLEAYSTLMPSRTELYSTTSIPTNFSKTLETGLPNLMIFLSCLVIILLVVAMAVNHLKTTKRWRAQRDIETEPRKSYILAEEEDTDSQEQFDNLLGCVHSQEYVEVVDVTHDTIFVKSLAFERGIRLLETRCALMIIGYPGSGKSMTARGILRHFQKKGWICSIFDTLENVCVDMDVTRQVVFLDNCLGKRDFQPSLQVVHHMREILSPLLTCGYRQADGIKLILTMEKRAFEKYKYLLTEIRTLDDAATVDIDSRDSYTTAERRRLIEIISGDMEQSNEQRIQEILKENSGACCIGFPLKVWLLKKIPGIQVNSNNWIGALRKAFDDMRISQEDVEKQRNYAALMYVMLKGRFSLEDELDEQCMEQLHSPPLRKEDLHEVLSTMSGYIKIRDKHTFVYAHEILYVAAFIEFHKNDPHTFFKYCNMRAILEIVKLPCDDTVANPLVINLPRDQYHLLADRIIKSGYQEEFFGRQLGEAATFGLILNRKQGIKETGKKLKATKANKDEKRIIELDKELKAQIQEYDELLHEIRKSTKSI